MSILLSTFGLIKQESMEKRHPIKARKYIIPVVAVGLIYFPDLHNDLGEKLANNPFHNPEPHWEVSSNPDYYELNRDKRTAAVTGTNTVMTFHENYSTGNLFE
jgi:hypothetical protein